MPAPHASRTQNQIASLRMREHDAIELPSAPFDAITPMQGLSRLPADCRRDRRRRGHRLWRRRQRCRHACAHRHDGGAGDRRAVLPASPTRAGYIRFGQRAPARRGRQGGHRRPRRRRDDRAPRRRAGCTPTRPSKRWSDAASATASSPCSSSSPATPPASAALFRLTRAAERGDTLAEEFAVGRLCPGQRTRRTLQRFRQPFDDRRRRRLGSRVWRLTDVTAERQREAARLASVEVQLAQFDSAPDRPRLGRRRRLRCCTSTARWRAGSGARSRSVLEQRLTLADITSGDGAGLVAACSTGPRAGRRALDVDLTREDGRIVPARLLARAVPSGKGLTRRRRRSCRRERRRVREPTPAARALHASSSRRRSASPSSAPTAASSSANAAFCRWCSTAPRGIGIAAADALCRSAEPETRSRGRGRPEARAVSGRVHHEPIEITVGAKRDHVTRVYMSPFAPPAARARRRSSTSSTRPSRRRSKRSSRRARRWRSSASSRAASRTTSTTC